MDFKTSLVSRWAWLLLLVAAVGCTLGPTPEPTALPPGETWNSPSPTAPSTLPELIEVLSGYNAEARIGAARALGAMGPDAEAAVPALTKNLYYEGAYDVREAAAWALGEIGPAAKPAVPMLIVVLLADRVHVRREAAIALGKIGDHTAIPALARGLYDEDFGVRIPSAQAIVRLAALSFPGATPTVLSFPGATPPITREHYIYDFDESGEAIIVLAAREWWEQEGWQQDWLH
jgi:hypothetical protein